jgi:plasmid stabilization system protein ParE
MRLVWRRAALRDLSRLANFIAELHPTRSAALADVLIAATSPLRQTPLMGRPLQAHAGVRELIVRFGSAIYIVQYFVDEARSDVVILRVFHGREARR